MTLKITVRYLLAFFALTFLMHELVHTSFGRLICGCWGERDFNVWGLCKGCSAEKPYALVVTFAVPIFTFAMMYVGAWMLLNHNGVAKRAFGFSLIFANIPLARVLKSLSGGGDEVYGLNAILVDKNLATVIGLSIVLLAVAYPLYRAWHAIDIERKLLWLLMFLILPVVVDLLLVLGLMNTLLENGLLADYGILGSPILITCWTIAIITIFLLSRKHLTDLID